MQAPIFFRGKIMPESSLSPAVPCSIAVSAGGLAAYNFGSAINNAIRAVGHSMDNTQVRFVMSEIINVNIFDPNRNLTERLKMYGNLDNPRVYDSLKKFKSNLRFGLALTVYSVASTILASYLYGKGQKQQIPN
jgi:hypothetical protein